MPISGPLTLADPSEYHPRGDYVRFGQGWREVVSRPVIPARQEELIIANALSNEEGRTALAEAMVAPIRRAMDYQGIGRQMLMVDEMPQGALARYERDVSAVAEVMSRNGNNPISPNFTLRETIGPAIMNANALSRVNFVADQSPEDVEAEREAARLSAQEARLNRVFGANENGDVLTPGALNSAFASIERLGNSVTQVSMPAEVYQAIREMGYEESVTQLADEIGMVREGDLDAEINEFELDSIMDVAEDAELVAMEQLAGALGDVTDEAAERSLAGNPDTWTPPIPEGEEVLVPTFEVASNPQISLSDIRRRFHIVDFDEAEAPGVERAMSVYGWLWESAFPGDGSRWEDI